MQEKSNPEELAGLKKAVQLAGRARELNRFELANGLTANVFPFRELIPGDEQKKQGIAIVINPSDRTEDPRHSIVSAATNIKARLPEGTTVREDRETHYLSGTDAKYDTVALFVDPGSLKPAVAKMRINEALQGMAAPDHAPTDPRGRKASTTSMSFP
jgi:hypothetical protein